MKKIFTLIAAALMAVGVNAETLIDFAQDQEHGITLSGSTVVASVKIHNADAISGIKFANSYSSDGQLTENYAVLTVEGGFKAGDVITIAGAFNNSDNTKKAAVDIFTVDGTTPTVLFTTQQFINGKDKEADPVEETFTLTEDAEILYLGRNGNTATFVTTLKVVRGEESDITAVLPPTEAKVWDFTAELGSADEENLTADTENWKFNDDEGKNYWQNNATLSERNVYTALMANGAELELTSGLEFARDHSKGLEADRIRIKPGKFFAINGSNTTMKLGELVKDDVVKLRFRGAGDSERELIATNAEVTEGSLTTADVEDHEVTLTVIKNGVVSLTTGNGFQFLAIAINDELPEVVDTAIKSVVENNKVNGAIFNLAGQQVSKAVKGVYIQNGKKFVVK